MLIRDYQPEDFPKLSRLWDNLDMGGKERGDTAELVMQTLNMGGKLLVMEELETGRIVGSSWMTFDGRRVFLHHFGIERQHQRRGLGLKLAIESLKFIKQKGNQVKLEVHKENLPAKRLYEKIGFKVFPDYDIYMIRKPGEIDPEKLS